MDVHRATNLGVTPVSDKASQLEQQTSHVEEKHGDTSYGISAK